MSRGVVRRIAVVLVVALVASSAIVAGAGEGTAQTADDDDPEPADEIYVEDDGDAVLVYRNGATDGSTVEYGVDVGSNVFYALVEGPVESDSGVRAELTSVVTQDGLTANGSATVPRTGELEAVEEFSLDASGETTSETNQFDVQSSATINNSELDDEAQLGRLVESASVAGNLSTTPTRFETSTEFQATLLQSLGPDRQERFTITESDGEYTVDASRDYVVSSFVADSYDTESEARQTLQSQFGAAAQQLGGEATVTIQSYGFDGSTNRLDIEFEVEYTGVEEGLANQLAAQLAAAEDVDLNQSQIDTITTRFQRLNVDEASLTYDQSGTSASGSFTLNLQNYDEWVRAGLTIAEAADAEATADVDFDAVRARLDAQEEANLQQRFEYDASLDQPNADLTTVSADLQYRTTNWAAYVDALGSDGPTVDRDFSLTASTEGDAIVAEGSLNVSGRELFEQAASNTFQGTDPETERFVEAFRDAELEKARFDLSIDDSRVRIEAGATFRNLSAVRDALAETSDAPRVTEIVGRTENGEAASYVRVEDAVSSGATEDDVRALPYVDSDTTVNMPDEWDREFPSVDLQRAADFLGVSVTPGDGDDGDDGDDTADGATVSLQPASAQVQTGGTVTYDVVVDGIDDGVGSYVLVVNTSDTSRARVTGVSADVGTGRTTVAADGSGAKLAAFAADTADTGPVTVGTVTLEGVATGSASVSVTPDTVSDETGSQYTVASATGADLSVVDEVVGPDVNGDGNPATDPDGDGVYEDVNGDGDATPGDATVLFNAVFDGNPAVVNNVALFDFNDDGAATPGDATALFNEIFG